MYVCLLLHVHVYVIYQLRFHNLQNINVYVNFEDFVNVTSEMTSFTFVALTQNMVDALDISSLCEDDDLLLLSTLLK